MIYSESPPLEVSNYNIVVAVLGGFLSIFGLVSYLCKERFYLSEAFISAVAGLILSPHAANFIRPLEYAQNSPQNLNAITLYFTRLVLGVQLVLAGIQLPSKYLKVEWRSLSMLLGPVMITMWMVTSFIMWALIPNISILQALAVGSCVTPTDPILSNSIVKGKFADKNIPDELQKIIIAESGTNDGLGYPFLFLALYLLKYTGDGGAGTTGGAAKAMGTFFAITIVYEILMSILYGFLIGWLFKEALHWAEEHKYVDRESFLVFAISIALFISGTAGMLGTDDVLACFIAGNAFTWDDWFRQETKDDSFQPTIDMLLNVAIFAWFGAICPWYQFLHNDVIPIYRLIPLAIMILLFRRLPIIFALHTKIRQIEEWRQALFVGFFGPIGVSAIFYLYLGLSFLDEITVDGIQRADAAHLSEVFIVVIWFMVICSIIVHGLSIPLVKLSINLPRTISKAYSSSKDENGDSNALRNFGHHIRERSRSRGRKEIAERGNVTPDERHVGSGTQSPMQEAHDRPDPDELRAALGRRHHDKAKALSKQMPQEDALKVALEPRHHHQAVAEQHAREAEHENVTVDTTGMNTPRGRKIRFGDEKKREGFRESS